MGKKDVDASMEEDDEEESVVVLSPIAKPLAKDKLVKKILKLVKTGQYCIRCGTRSPPRPRRTCPFADLALWFRSPTSQRAHNVWAR